MKNRLWTKTLLESYLYLARIVPTLDKVVNDLCVNSYKVCEGSDATLKLVSDIATVIARKAKLNSLKEMIEDTLHKIPIGYAKILVQVYIDKKQLKKLAFQKGVEYKDLRHQFYKALDTFYNKLSEQGLDVITIEEKYLDERWLVGIYNNNLAKAKRVKTKKEEINTPLSVIYQKSSSFLPPCWLL